MCLGEQISQFNTYILERKFLKLKAVHPAWAHARPAWVKRNHYGICKIHEQQVFVTVSLLLGPLIMIHFKFLLLIKLAFHLHQIQ